MQTTKLKTNTQLLPPKHPSKASTILNHCLYISQTHTTSPKTKSTNTNTKAIALCLNCLCLNLHLTQSNLYWSHDESIILQFFLVWLCAAHSVLVRLCDCEIVRWFVVCLWDCIQLCSQPTGCASTCTSRLLFVPINFFTSEIIKIALPLLQMRFSPEGKTPGKNWPPRKEEVYDTPQEWLRRIGRARVQRERESNTRNDLHADSDRRVESPKASRVHSSRNGSGLDTM